MDLIVWFYYVLTIILLTITPGPNVLLCITTSINSSFKLSIYSAFGGFLATSIIFTLSFLGLGAIILSSTTLFLFIKYTGALYLIYLGYKAIKSKQLNYDINTNNTLYKSKLKTFISGFIVGASNPKAIIFFIALFPQFINYKEELFLQFIILYSTFAFFELFWLFTYSYFANKSSNWFKHGSKAKIFNRLTGGIFIGIGSYLFFSK